MKPVSKDDKLFYFERQFFTLDGLWIVEVENELDLDTALHVDLKVWKRLLSLIYKRVTTYLHADTSRIDDIVNVLAFRWSCEQWEYRIEHANQHDARVIITKCPYKEMMQRNPGRHAVIPRVCKEICIPIYDEAIHALNPSVIITRERFQGLGDDTCDFCLALE